MATKPRLTRARLKELLRYDPETGEFTWRVRRGGKATSGCVAGTVWFGYRQILIDKWAYKAHRLAWFYVNGVWPVEIDHANCDKDDNRLANLREVTRCQNLQNVRRFASNKSGFKGVGWHNGQWRARITVENRTIFLGHFPTAENAYSAYCAAARQHHGEFARLE